MSAMEVNLFLDPSRQTLNHQGRICGWLLLQEPSQSRKKVRASQFASFRPALRQRD